MARKEKAQRMQLKSTLHNILFYVEDPKEQEKMLNILSEYNEHFKDSKLKNFIDEVKLFTKTDYYSKVQHFLDDIFEKPFTTEEKKLIQSLVAKIQPIVQEAERNLWKQFTDLFKWS